MQVTFNTNRRYTARGQIVTAQWSEELEQVLFKDHCRGISGKIDCPSTEITFRTPGGLARWTMEHYDRSDYRWDADAMNLEEDAKVLEFGL